MSFVLCLYFFTFLAMPFLALILSSYLSSEWMKRLLQIGMPLFLIYNILLFSGYSLTGDYADYLMLSLEYLFAFMAIMGYRKFFTNVFSKVLGAVMYTVWVMGIIVALPQMTFLSTADMEYTFDKRYKFKNDGKLYETRRYDFSFETAESRQYTFRAYREFNFLPIEKLIDETALPDSKNSFDGGGDDLQISFVIRNGNETLLFRAPGKGEFMKEVR